MIRIGPDPFDAGRETSAFQERCAGVGVGALVVFTGLVRSGDEGRKLRSLTIEHYPGMTESEIARIEAEARRRWSLHDVLILHRYGTLFPGDPIVLVATAAAHRDAAFAGAEFIMDYLKTSAPFWKKETFADGTARWVESRHSDEVRREAWAQPAAGKSA